MKDSEVRAAEYAAIAEYGAKMDTQTAEIRKCVRAAQLGEREERRLLRYIDQLVYAAFIELPDLKAALREDNPTVSGDDNKEANHG